MNHLPEKEAQQIIKALSLLFLFAYKKENEDQISEGNISDILAKGSNILFRDEETSRRYIDEYLKIEHMGKHQRNIISRWKGQVKRKQLYFMDESQDYEVVFDREEGKTYFVKSLSDPLSFTLRVFRLPIKIEYTILPYKNFYIMDCLGNCSNIGSMEELPRIYEEYRLSTLHQPAWISENETMPVIQLQRIESDDINEIFIDYIHPLLYLLEKPSELEDIVKTGIMIWNDGLLEKSQLEEYKDDGLVKIMRERKINEFSAFHQYIESCHVVGNHGLSCKLKIRQ